MEYNTVLFLDFLGVGGSAGCGVCHNNSNNNNNTNNSKSPSVELVARAASWIFDW